MSTFGSQVGSVKDLKRSVSNVGGLMTFVPAEGKGTITVRFLNEPEEWLGYRQVYDQVRKASWPVPPDDSMPGTPDEDARVSKRYLANAVNTETDKVIAIQLPASLVEDLLIRYDRFNTMIDRDYLLGRTGTGLDTDYYCDPEPPTNRKTDKYKMIDLEDVLVKSYEAIWGDATASGAGSSRSPGARPAVGARKRTPVPIGAESKPEELDLEDLASKADGADDPDAAEAITAAADEFNIDPEEYGTWAEVVEAIQAAQIGSDAPEAEDGDEAPEPEPEADTDALDAPEKGLDEMTWAELGEIGDGEDEDAAVAAIEELTATAEEAGLDTNDFPTWAELGEKLDEVTGDVAEGEAEGSWTEDDLKPKPIGDLRAIARDGGVTTSGLNKAQLIDAILQGGF